MYYWHSLFSNWAEIELYLFINFVFFLLKNPFYYFREVVLWMSWLVLKDFLWPWMNWDIQDLNCQTWSRYNKLFLYVWCNWKTCRVISLVCPLYLKGWLDKFLSWKWIVSFTFFRPSEREPMYDLIAMLVFYHCEVNIYLDFVNVFCPAPPRCYA